MKLKDIIKFFVSFLLMFSLLFIQISLFVNFRLLNSQFYIDTLKKSNYFTYLNSSIDENSKYLSVMTAIPEEVFQKSISKTYIKEETFKNVSEAVNYMRNANVSYNFKVNDSYTAELLQNNFESYAKKNNIKVNSSIKGQLATVTEVAASNTSGYINLFNINAVSKYDQFQEFRSICIKLVNFSFIFAASALLFILILLSLNIDNKKQSLMWIGSSFIPAGLMTFIPSALAFIFRISSRISISTAYVNEALSKFVSGYFIFLIFTGGIFVLAGIILIIISSKDTVSSN